MTEKSEIRVPKKEIRRRLNQLRIRIEDLKTRHYGVSVKYYTGQEPQLDKRIDYDVAVDLKVADDMGVIRIDKKNILFNQHAPDTINEMVTDRMSKSLYPVETSMNERGYSHQEVLNHEEILKRWEQEKKTLFEKYQSADLSGFYADAEEYLKNTSILEERFRYDWFWSLFFHPKLVDYGDYRTVDATLLLSVIPFQSPLRFSGTQKIEKVPTDYHSFTVHFKSEEYKAPRYFYPKGEWSGDSLLMTLNVTFDMDVYHHFPMNTHACFEVYSRRYDDSKIPHRKIEFTMYQTNTEEYQHKTLNEDSAFITGGMVNLSPDELRIGRFEDYKNIENDW